MEAKKLSSEQLEGLKLLNERFTQLTRVYGELHLQKRIIERDIFTAENEFDALEAERTQTVQRLQAEFGTTGVINLATGEFKPDQQ